LDFVESTARELDTLNIAARRVKPSCLKFAPRNVENQHKELFEQQMEIRDQDLP
jgi:adenylyl- and sulfurtransferase ThiI